MVIYGQDGVLSPDVHLATFVLPAVRFWWSCHMDLIRIAPELCKYGCLGVSPQSIPCHCQGDNKIILIGWFGFSLFRHMAASLRDYLELGIFYI